MNTGDKIVTGTWDGQEIWRKATAGEVLAQMIKTCQKCDGTGIIQVPNGEDDFDYDFCTCAAGQNAEHIVSNEIVAHVN